jgi:PBSX family phage portal protein
VATRNKVPVIKGYAVDGPGGGNSGSSGGDSQVGALNHSLQNVQTIQGLLDPPFDLKKLSLIYEMSGALQQHIEAVTTNVDQFGWRYDPALKFDDPDIDAKIAEAMFCEKIDEATKLIDIKPPTAAQVTARKNELELVSKAELNKLKSFFAVCYPDGSFIDLRTKTRKNLEITGNCYWEMLRDGAGKVARIVLAPVCYIRLTPIDSEPTIIQDRVPVSDTTWKEVPQKKFFRRFAEVGNDQKKVKAYFKEFGDPRVVSRLTGRVFESLEKMMADKDIKPEDGPATELFHLKNYSPISDPYGVPRWIGNLPAVLGSRELDEVNLGYFENKTVPPLALLVAGGRLSKGVVPRIEEFIEQNLKGRKNFHKILILEAEGQKNAAGMNIIPTVKFVPLREAQQQDGLFQKYDEANWAKIGSSFRLPRLLVGKDDHINRATADASLQFAEEQVFEPMRNFFDDMINRKIFADLNITFWKFKSNTPITRNPELLSDVIKKLSDSGVITPGEARTIAADIFNRALPRIDVLWTQQPFKLTLAEAQGRQGIEAGFDEDEHSADNTESADDKAAAAKPVAEPKEPVSKGRAFKPLLGIGETETDDDE